MDVSLNDIILQKEEVDDVMWADANKIRQLIKEGKFDANAFIDRVLYND